MVLTDVSEVVIDLYEGNKFIVAMLIDTNGEERLVVRANARCVNHSHIHDLLLEEVRPNGLRAALLGGGSIQVNHKAKTIRIWGKSGDFGQEPDRQQTVAMLQKAFPDFQVTIC